MSVVVQVRRRRRTVLSDSGACLDARPGPGHRVLAGAGHVLTDPAWRSAFQQVVLEFSDDLGSR